ncbi:MAG: hypothetical protein RBT41_06545, partial [Clostridia bacterium]|nr:hypothetical protein [Clostridia bacterium]
MKIIKRLTTILIIMSVMVGGSSTVFASNSSAQTIQEAKDYNAQKKLKIYESSAFFKTDYIKMEIINNEMLSINGRIDVEKTNWLFKIDHVDKGNKLNIIKEVNEIKSNHTYENTFVLRNKLKEGEYKISIYFEENHDSMYWSYYRDISLN